MLFRVLKDFKPNKILELGLGQSTKIISSYVTNAKSIENECRHRVVEHDSGWISFFCTTYNLPNQTEVFNLELELIDDFSNGRATTYRYKDFFRELNDLCYDFIFVDGPYGWNKPEYSRIDCLDLIPDNLNESFVIMFHDVWRSAEKKTMELVEEKLVANGYKIISKTFSNVGLIISEDNRYLCWI